MDDDTKAKREKYGMFSRKAWEADAMNTYYSGLEDHLPSETNVYEIINNDYNKSGIE